MYGSLDYVYFEVEKPPATFLIVSREIDLDLIEQSDIKSIYASDQSMRVCGARFLIGLSSKSSKKKEFATSEGKLFFRVFTIYNRANEQLLGYFVLLAKATHGHLLQNVCSQDASDFFENNAWKQFAATPNTGKVSDRTKQIIRMTGFGLNSAEIGEILHLTTRGVDYHLSIAKEKLKATNKPNLVLTARNLGWI
ncbi:helix-turn-helix transcriptional regulator [Ferrimonas futtsuensis]|uniref:helix-turn-helix transcriptional regulator n=1 Tax=Ferrimonas futtsuensis TaxID=364764 RepID=UPI000484CCEB|nr:LuxR C-terminal-related transcriptional regulator [Ferrimonas futtsuensis]